jgi:hypothetical protein
MRLKHILAFLATTASFSAQAALITINFDDLGTNAVVSNQYAAATFGSSTGVVLTSAQAGLYDTSVPNIICTGASSTSGIDCVRDISVTFTDLAFGLSFLAVGDDDVGVVGAVQVYDDGGMLMGTVDIVADGNPLGTPILLDLSAFDGIGSILISTTDGAGLGYDDFTWQTQDVPEPGALALVALALLGAAVARRRA